MAQKTSGNVQISAPEASVVAVISDVEKYGEWTDGMSDIVIEARDEQGHPTQVSFSINAGAISDRVTLAYIWEPARLSWTLVKGTNVTELSGSYAWKSVPNGTEVTYELTADVSLPIPSFMKRVAEKTIISTALQGLKKQVESAR
ncbi:MAG: hypothetical protein RIS75_753 [Actinomycetota bacterium]|jgi:carbon monoxide dehydrogenase subunit G